MPVPPTAAGSGALLGAAMVGDGPDHGHGGGGGGGGGGAGPGSGLGNWSSLIGIITAIVGNILIALALNVQRYSHIQLNRRRVEARERAREIRKRAHHPHRNGYGAIEAPSRPSPAEHDHDHDNDAADDDDYDAADESHPLARSVRSSDSNWSESSAEVPKVASTYLKSPYWWLGQVLMTVGEMGNFLAYGFAPASIVSPLGVVALVSNCVIAPIFFGEAFRKRDFWGVAVAVGGAITVVLSAKGEETKLNPRDVWDAITTTAFEIYLGVTIFFIIVLMWASPRYGNKTILIDLSLVGLFGGYTVLTTKGVSSMLSSTLLKAFATPVTYGLVIILLGTAIMQVRYVNKALQNFDSTQVIPIQFVIFTLSVIIGSAVLYRDFERTTAEQAAKFIGGCLLTFFGVFLITSGRPRQDDDDHLSDDENVEETIGLRHQGGRGAYDNVDRATTQTMSASTSRRTSHASPTRFSHTRSSSRNELLIGTPPQQSVEQPPTPKAAVHTPAGTSPTLLINPWRDSVGDGSGHPGLPQAISADSVPTIHSIVSVAVSEPPQPSLNALSRVSSPERQVAPRPSAVTLRSHSHQHYSNAFISPSPLSSTVSAVVSDSLLRGEDSLSRRRKSLRTLRPTIRSSLFVPRNDDDVDAGASEPLLATRNGNDHLPAEYESASMHQASNRGRTRSLSNTLGRFFGRNKRRRRNSNPEAGEAEGSQVNGSLDDGD
ncbi:DUF803-domain-containing protein [Astrocystis sublimbata]|nr:DUF803-domain-containing protein [Astrocystis sublimbata]